MSIEQEVLKLSQLPLFAETEPARLRLLAMSADKVTFKAGETIISRGDAPKEVLLLLSGRAVAKNDLELQVLIGSVGVFLRKPQPATVTAATDVEALRLTRSEFMACIEHCHQTALAIIREYARRIDQFSEAYHTDSLPVRNEE
jgi:CRP-like cAMP-binding protein